MQAPWVQKPSCCRHRAEAQELALSRFVCCWSGHYAAITTLGVCAYPASLVRNIASLVMRATFHVCTQNLGVRDMCGILAPQKSASHVLHMTRPCVLSVQPLLRHAVQHSSARIPNTSMLIRFSPLVLVLHGDSMFCLPSPFLPCSHLGPRPMLSMHELSLSMPEPMLILSMLILALSPSAALDVTIRYQ